MASRCFSFSPAACEGTAARKGVEQNGAGNALLLPAALSSRSSYLQSCYRVTGCWCIRRDVHDHSSSASGQKKQQQGSVSSFNLRRIGVCSIHQDAEE
jgi:hypothetical protein